MLTTLLLRRPSSPSPTHHCTHCQLDPDNSIEHIVRLLCPSEDFCKGRLLPLFALRRLVVTWWLLLLHQLTHSFLTVCVPLLQSAVTARLTGVQPVRTHVRPPAFSARHHTRTRKQSCEEPAGCEASWTSCDTHTHTQHKGAVLFKCV